LQARGFRHRQRDTKALPHDPAEHLSSPSGHLTCFRFFGQCDSLFWTAQREPSDVEEAGSPSAGRVAQRQDDSHSDFERSGLLEAE
jgi:hypothetical protein